MKLKRSNLNLARRAASKAPKKRFILFCEDMLVGPDYFRALEKTLKHAIIEIEVIRAAGVPFTIAEKAAERSQKEGLTPGASVATSSFEEHDEIWAVYDVDEHPKLEEAYAKCVANGVHVAISNPCFEIWLILHFEDFDRPDNRHQVQAHFRTLDPEYHPQNNKTTNCVAIMDRVFNAEKRAAILSKRRTEEGRPGGPPSTTVNILTERIRSISIPTEPNSKSDPKAARKHERHHKKRAS